MEIRCLERKLTIQNDLKLNFQHIDDSLFCLVVEKSTVKRARSMNRLPRFNTIWKRLWSAWPRIK